MKSDKTPRSVELYHEVVQFFEGMVKKHQLPDFGKTVRCLIRHARERAERQQQIFDEMRCHQC